MGVSSLGAYFLTQHFHSSVYSTLFFILFLFVEYYFKKNCEIVNSYECYPRKGRSIVWIKSRLGRHISAKVIPEEGILSLKTKIALRKKLRLNCFDLVLITNKRGSESREILDITKTCKGLLFLFLLQILFNT